jgi:PleD family two-component response regulator
LPGDGPGRCTKAAAIDLSVGVATLVSGSDIGPDVFLGQADQALYAAKHLGRNRVISADTLLADISKLHGRKSGE